MASDFKDVRLWICLADWRCTRWGCNLATTVAHLATSVADFYLTYLTEPDEFSDSQEGSGAPVVECPGITWLRGLRMKRGFVG
jgi:hypothetical protein